MEHRIFHGQFSSTELVECLQIHFNRGNLLVQKVDYDDGVGIQIKTRDHPTSGGDTALGIYLKQVEDGVSVQVGQQTWLGIAASLGYSALATFLNPANILNRLDDIAQDVEYLQLSDEVWKVLEANARSLGSGYELSERLRRIKCPYCEAANRVGTPTCIACGAPLGNTQPISCSHCGFIVTSQQVTCPNCKKRL
ncbi:MAG: zinc ribbon domain-containing protein [Chloroflexi bacterium]|nr:zinc ribbon domain-containing protein [Chloroflexota bacterium]